MLPTERLLELAGATFSHDWLIEVSRVLEHLPILTPQARVSVFVMRRVCWEVAAWMDSVQPIDVPRHARLESELHPMLRQAVEHLARRSSSGLEWEILGQLVAASERARIIG
jgi:hypothetical protein